MTDLTADPDDATRADDIAGTDDGDWVWHDTTQTWERSDGSGEAWTWDAHTSTWRATGQWYWDDTAGEWQLNPDWHGDGSTAGQTPEVPTPEAPTPAAPASDASPAPSPARSRGLGRHGSRRTIWVAAGLVAVAVVLGAFALFPDLFGLGKSADPKAYIPTTIDGKPVQDSGKMLGIMQSAFIGGAKYREGQVQIAAGLVESRDRATTTAPAPSGGIDNRFPELVVMAIRRLDGPPLAESLEKTLGSGATSGERVEIKGVPAKVYRNDSFGEGTVFVAATPRDDLVLLALAFAPNDEAITDSSVAEGRAVGAVEAMLAESDR